MEVDRLIFLYRRIYKDLIENQNLLKMIRNLIFAPRRGTPYNEIEQYQHHNFYNKMPCHY